ncbi:hypothetical protein [Bacillus sp. FJAT-28004]|uniref:hypothetical protein n=1 Tax=Bacillus sp. FJAT-28004 TaxID=1679165 RepID=UPI0006B5E0BC|nr:hypothetical protein [Bacillus sp. FJAT-28004]
MTEPLRNHLKVLGETTSAGGFYQNVNITGECKFNGDVDCEKLRLTGEVKIAGNLKAKDMKITGVCAVDGSLNGLSLQGRGEMRTSGGLRVDKINLTGHLDVVGDCEADELQMTGAVSIDGLLSSDRLNISMFGPSWAKEVGGSKISIKRSKVGTLLKLMKSKEGVIFKAGLIEGDNIELHYTKADMVRGESVIIGPDCEIQTVEYRDVLKIHKSASVKNQVKL